MATSPLFGWQEPDDTSLVKDGAAAIRTLGNAIDSSMGDLLGGTTGQVLAKASNTNMDFTWVAQDDSNAIQNAIVDAKGDLIAATANDTPARLAVGNNGETLVADSSTSTGLKWAKSPNFVGCVVFRATPQVLANNTLTAIGFDSEVIDTDGFHSNVTSNARIFIPAGLGGKYLISISSRFGLSATGFRTAALYKNGGQLVDITEMPGNGSQYEINSKSFILDLAVGDYLELGASQNSGGNLDFFARQLELPFSIQYLGA